MSRPPLHTPLSRQGTSTPPPPPAALHRVPSAHASFTLSPHPKPRLSSPFSFSPSDLLSPALLGDDDANASILSASPRIRRRRTGLRVSYAPAAGETTDEDEGERLQLVGEGRGDGGKGDGEEGMAERMRLWRHDAMMQHLYDTAAFWGDKVLSLTHDPNDAFWLAQIHFLTHAYARSEQLLTRPFPPAPSPSSSSPFAHPATNGHAPPQGQSAPQPSRRLVEISIACRYLAAQCQVRQGKWTEALEMLGDENPFRQRPRSGPKFKNPDGGVKLESSTCYLRGLIHLQLNASDRAKTCFLEALALDVKNYEAFERLVGGGMMRVDEEWEFIQSLSYAEQTEEDAEFVRMMYTIRLKKYKHAPEMAAARAKLADEYRLGENADVLQSWADTLYAQCRFAECFVVTSKILSSHPSHAPTLPLHLACMTHLPTQRASALFLLAHALVEHDPDSASSWYAVGVWYYAGKRWAEARRFFSKASLMDPRFGPAWLGFAHSFAMEGEHDQAITAYSTAARLFQGTHLPILYIGMQHLQLSNLVLAEEHLDAAAQICGDVDPLLLHERGVVAYYQEEYEKAIGLFQTALELARNMQSGQTSWAMTHLNLGQAYRRSGRLRDAQRSFERVIDLDPQCAAAYTSLGLVHHELGDVHEAIVRYHEALSLHPAEPITTALVNLAMDANVTSTSAESFRGLPHAFREGGAMSALGGGEGDADGDARMEGPAGGVGQQTQMMSTAMVSMEESGAVSMEEESMEREGLTQGGDGEDGEGDMETSVSVSMDI